MIKIAIVAIVGVCLINLVKGVRGDFVPFIVIGITGILMVFLTGQLKSVVELLNRFKNYTRIENNYFMTLIKMMGIAYVAEFASSICKDCGYSSLAGQVEMAGKTVIMCMSLPIILALLETITLLF